MPNWAFAAVVRMGLAAVLVWSLALTPSGFSASHDPLARATAEAVRHAQLELERAEHGHTHEDGEPDEQGPGHSHGHNAADHSHETPATPPVAVVLQPVITRSWPARPLSRPFVTVASRLERPPRA